ncbi:MAG TPA: phosphoribosylamine--glycine ligase [Acidimicrobiia bacterium]|nr:phosphoribosylamine--glycine ligase [Acidimicrobiia bacterium]
MRALVLGGDGRAHALAWALDNSASVDEVVAGPGNPGIAAMGKRCVPVRANDPADVVRLAGDVEADMVVVSAEEPLVHGVADALRSHGTLVFGPGADGARLEGSKAWMKAVLSEAGVPTARHAAFTADQESEALNFLERLPGLYVVKTDGLAGGKGVTVTESIGEARDAVRAYLSGRAFGDAGRTCVIEEGLIGPELSLLVVCNGTMEGRPLAPAQDFKRIGDGDRGPNTGGMGAYSPVPVAGAEVVAEVMERAVTPTLHALAARDITYRGVLYAGLMLTPDGVKVLEYNVRFGDPEAQAVLPRLASDVGQLCWAAASGRAEIETKFRDDACVTVVLATEGYPASPRKGDVIEGIDDAEQLPGVTVFHAGTKQADGGRLLTAGGRVLDVTAVAPTLGAARDRAYEAAGRITWRGVQYRRDIAAAAVESSGKEPA